VTSKIFVKINTSKINNEINVSRCVVVPLRVKTNIRLYV